MQELFMSDARILIQLVSESLSAEHIADDVAVVKQIASVSQLVTRRLQSEQRYLARLEGEMQEHPEHLPMPPTSYRSTIMIQQLLSLDVEIYISAAKSQRSSVVKVNRPQSCTLEYLAFFP